MAYTYADYQKCADYLKKVTGATPKIAIVLGTRLGFFAAQIDDPIVVRYADVPNFLVSTVPSHAGELVFGTVAGKSVVCMSGRFHFYEGYDFEQLSIPIRVLRLMGVETVLLTNAAGAINTNYQVGDVMLIRDHIKLFGSSPMRGANIPEFGPRFFDVTDMYTKTLRECALQCAQRTTLHVHEGVYMFFSGPQFETPAEIHAAQMLGADAVGMSTVTEALTAAHCGMAVLGLSVITNMAAGILDRPLTTDEVKENMMRVTEELGAYIIDIIRSMEGVSL